MNGKRQSKGYAAIAMTIFMTVLLLVSLLASFLIVMTLAASDVNATTTHGGGDRVPAPWYLISGIRAKGSDTEPETLTFNVTKSPIVWNPYGNGIQKSINTDDLVKINNSGSYTYGTWWVQLSCNNSNLNLSLPGSWYLAYDNWTNFNDTATSTVTCELGTEVMNGAANTYNYSSYYTEAGKYGLDKSIESAVYDSETGQYTLTTYNSPRHMIPSGSPIVFNYTLVPYAESPTRGSREGATETEFYIDFAIVQNRMPAAGVYNITYTIRGFDSYASYIDWRDEAGSRGVVSDAITGSTVLTITPTLNFALKYSGTHTNDWYLPSAAGASTTVYSANYMICENSGNLPISKLKFSIGAAANKWKNAATGADTTYTPYGNTYIRKAGQVNYDLLEAATIEYSYSPQIPVTSDLLIGNLNYRELDLKVANMALSVGNYTYALLKVTATDATGVYVKDMYAYCKLTVYSGTIAIQVSYSTGTALSWPQMNPGQVDTLTSNSAVITNSANSDYEINKLQIALAPMASSTNTLSFGERSSIVLTTSGGNTYEYDLLSYSTNGVNYGRCLIDLGGVGQPGTIAAGSAVSFTCKLKLLPTTQAPGAYSGSFVVEASANPIATGSGITGLSTSGIVDQTIAAAATPNPAVINQTVTLTATVVWPASTTPWSYVVFQVVAPNGTTLKLSNVLISTDAAELAATEPSATTHSLSVSGGSIVLAVAGSYAFTASQATIDDKGAIQLAGDSHSISITVTAGNSGDTNPPATTTNGTWYSSWANFKAAASALPSKITSGVAAHPYWTGIIIFLVVVAAVYFGPKFSKRYFAMLLTAGVLAMLVMATMVLPIMSASAEVPTEGVPVYSAWGDYYNNTAAGASGLYNDIFTIKDTATAGAYLAKHYVTTTVLIAVLVGVALMAARKKHWI